MKKRIIIGFLSLAMVSVCVVSGFYFFNRANSRNDMSYNNFLEKVEMGTVTRVEIKSEETLEVTMKDKTIAHVPNPMKDDLKEFLLHHDIKVVNGSEVKMTSVLSALFVLSVVAGVFFYTYRGNNFSKQFVQRVDRQKIQKTRVITFSQIAGNDEAKLLVKDIIDFIRNPEKYHATGATMPTGILLYGSPGTGKTLIARAIAGEAGVPFYSLSGSDFVQMYVGVGAKRVRELFAKARKDKKAIIFIDEIDALGKSRGNGATSGNDEREQTLNALLTEMSGFNNSDGIVVIGATNRLDTLDAALIRPGRFDRQIEVTLPDKKARKEIIHLYMEEKPFEEGIDVEKLALATVMFSGAMLENLVNEAAIIAANKGDSLIRQKHIDEALYHVVAGKEKQYHEQTISPYEKRITAYHEVGHALISRELCPRNTIMKITIIPTTRGAAGYNYNIPKDRMYKTKNDIINGIKVLLAGRAAEEIIFGKDHITTGASNDIKVASKELYQFYKVYGMDESYGMFNLDQKEDDTAVIEQCRERMKLLYEETKRIIENNRKRLDIVADALIKNETLCLEELDALFSTECMTEVSQAV